MELNQKVADFTLQTDEDKTDQPVRLRRQARRTLLLPQSGHSWLHH